MPTRLLRALMLCAVLSLTLTPAYGQKTWTGATNTNWSTATNWNPSGVPNGDQVFMYDTGSNVVNLDSGTATIYSLDLGSSSTQASLAGNGTVNLTIAEWLTISAGSSLVLRAGDVITQADSFSFFYNFGTLNIAKGAQLHTVDRAVNDTVYAGSSYDIEGSLTPDYLFAIKTIQAGAGSVAAGQLTLANGQVWDIVPTGSLGPTPLTNSGQLLLGNGTTLNVNGDVVNNGIFGTYGSNNSLNVDCPPPLCTLTNNKSFTLGSNDSANVTWLTNNGQVLVFPGATLTLAGSFQPGITATPANSVFEIFGTFNQTFYKPNPSAFYNLTTNDGNVSLLNGQTTDITPSGGALLNSGLIDLDLSSTLNIHGTLNNTTALASFNVWSGSVANLGALNNNGIVFIAGQVFLLNQPNGITTIAAGSSFLLDGEFYAGAITSAPNGFYKLDTIDGALALATTQTIDVTPGGVVGGTLTISKPGSFQVANGNTFNLHGTLDNNGYVRVGPGGTLNLLNQPGGITDIVAGSEFELDGGTFNAGVNNAFYDLDYVHGTLKLDGTSVNVTITPSTPTKNVEVWGLLKTFNGATLTVVGGVAVMQGAGFIVGDPFPTTVNISGTLTNLGGSIDVIGPDAFLNAGSIVNGGMLSLPGGSTVTVADGFYQLDAGTLGESIGASGFGVLVATDGQMMLAGTLDIMLDPGFNPTIGSTYQFILFKPGELSGMFASIQNLYFNNGTEKWIVNYNNAGGYVELQAASAPAPEPASMLLLASGLLTLGYDARRRLKR